MSQEACPNAPWSLTFSYGRALQSATLKVCTLALILLYCMDGRLIHYIACVTAIRNFMSAWGLLRSQAAVVNIGMCKHTALLGTRPYSCMGQSAWLQRMPTHIEQTCVDCQGLFSHNSAGFIPARLGKVPGSCPGFCSKELFIVVFELYIVVTIHSRSV